MHEIVLAALQIGRMCMSKEIPRCSSIYHIALLDKPTLVWDFHSLLLGIQMMFTFMLTDEEKPQRRV